MQSELQRRITLYCLWATVAVGGVFSSILTLHFFGLNLWVGPFAHIDPLRSLIGAWTITVLLFILGLLYRRGGD